MRSSEGGLLVGQVDDFLQSHDLFGLVSDGALSFQNRKQRFNPSAGELLDLMREMHEAPLMAKERVRPRRHRSKG